VQVKVLKQAAFTVKHTTKVPQLKPSRATLQFTVTAPIVTVFTVMILTRGFWKCNNFEAYILECFTKYHDLNTQYGNSAVYAITPLRVHGNCPELEDFNQ
jgi:hypothetical protein